MESLVGIGILLILLVAAFILLGFAVIAAGSLLVLAANYLPGILMVCGIVSLILAPFTGVSIFTAALFFFMSWVLGPSTQPSSVY